jgi:hypothetical protein
MGATGFTTTAATAIQPVEPSVYVMITVPEDIPVTIPLLPPTVASSGLPLLHIPPGMMSLSVIVCPTHTFVGPVIAAGDAITVATIVTEHPPSV